MTFSIFAYIIGTLIAINGYFLSRKKGTLHIKMDIMQALVIIGNRIIGTVHICTGVIIIIIIKMSEG